MGRRRDNAALGAPSDWRGREKKMSDKRPTAAVDVSDPGPSAKAPPGERFITPGTVVTDDMFREAFMKSMQVYVNGQVMPSMNWTFKTVEPETPEQTLTRERDAARNAAQQASALVKQRDEFIEKLKESPQSIVTVMRMVGGKRGVIQVGGAALEVNLPEGCRVGDQVKILVETSQAVSKADEPMVFGMVVTVDRVELDARRCYFELAGGGQQSAAIAADMIPPEPGERVQLDPTGTVAMLNLGRDKTKYSIETCPTTTWDDIGGQEEAKEALREALEYPTTFADTYSAYGAPPSKGVLLYGPPGTGKTLLAKAAANSVGNGGFIYVKGAELLSKWVGESEATVRGLFQRAREHKKRTGSLAVIFIDEADALLGARGSGSMVGALASTVVPSFLAEMDGVEDSGAFVILSTNRPDTLDPAVVRDGRIDRRIRVGRPDRKSTRDILRLAVRGKLFPTFAEVEDRIIDLIFSDRFSLYRFEFEASADEYVRLSDMLSGAIITGFINRAVKLAIRRDRGGESLGVTFDDMDRAVTESFSEIASLNPIEPITERIETLGKIPTNIRKSTSHAGSEAPHFTSPVNYGTHVQGTRGGALN